MNILAVSGMCCRPLPTLGDPPMLPLVDPLPDVIYPPATTWHTALSDFQAPSPSLPHSFLPFLIHPLLHLSNTYLLNTY